MKSCVVGSPCSLWTVATYVWPPRSRNIRQQTFTLASPLASHLPAADSSAPLGLVLKALAMLRQALQQVHNINCTPTVYGMILSNRLQELVTLKVRPRLYTNINKDHRRLSFKCLSPTILRTSLCCKINAWAEKYKPNSVKDKSILKLNLNSNYNLNLMQETNITQHKAFAHDFRNKLSNIYYSI